MLKKCLLPIAAAGLLAGCAQDLSDDRGVDPAEPITQTTSERSSGLSVPLGEFRATYDADTGELTFENYPISHGSVEVATDDALAMLQQAVYCTGEVTSSPTQPNAFRLATVNNSTKVGDEECGFPPGSVSGLNPYIAGTFCGTVAVFNNYPTDMFNVMAEIYERAPSDFKAFPPPYGTTLDPDTLPEGENRPTWEGGGLFLHGEDDGEGSTYIPAGARADRQWVFMYPGESGSFTFQGRMWAEFPDGYTPCDVPEEE